MAKSVVTVDQFIGVPLEETCRVICFDSSKKIGAKKAYDGDLRGFYSFIEGKVVKSVIEPSGATHYGPFREIKIPDTKNGGIWRVNF